LSLVVLAMIFMASASAFLSVAYCLGVQHAQPLLKRGRHLTIDSGAASYF